GNPVSIHGKPEEAAHRVEHLRFRSRTESTRGIERVDVGRPKLVETDDAAAVGKLNELLGEGAAISVGRVGDARLSLAREGRHGLYERGAGCGRYRGLQNRSRQV